MDDDEAPPHLSKTGADFSLPADFEARAVAQFDKLIEQGELFYAQSKGEVIDHAGFKFEFRASPSIVKKPILARDAPERRGQGGPFLNPDPAFVVAELGDSYVVELSKYAMYRPHYVLHTRHFAPQTDDLDMVDFAAAVAVMYSESAGTSGNVITNGSHRHHHANGTNGNHSTNGTNGTNGETMGPPPPPPAAKTQRLMLYNCGYDAGASQGHKHTQVFEIPKPFPLFPSRADSTERKPFPPFLSLPPPSGLPRARTDGNTHIGISSCLPGVPFRHYALRLPPRPGAEQMLDAYRRLLQEVRLLQELHGLKAAYNVVATAEWMCLIPRRRGGLDGTGANALGMLGVVWVRDGDERRHWDQLGLSKHLTYLGVPKDERKFSTDHRD
ncbi:uncharacterized protein E0L32_008476 [Thyridium curvatum]|uniref:Uncharacterized protein n=1 Tax=Thyridium curvatum TaxID=1093900 RepID=A0A507B213_9PEZI|nr:uncharacterized protein E0L32_008476 [Thyridium curvatum]TPX10590.1 hypothetical protein E0L32_008476 [Thyridium curvatum]